MDKGITVLGQDNLNPIPMDQRTMGIFSTFSLWLAAYVVVTTVLNGMMFIPDLNIVTAMIIIVIGSLVGGLPLVYMGKLGVRTGLPTMVLTRGAFGHKGSVLPSVINLILVVGFCSIQAYMGGLSLNYAVNYLTGYSNIGLFTIFTSIFAVIITLYGHRGIQATENIIASMMLGLSIIVFSFMFVKFNIADLVYMSAVENPETTTMIAFDLVVALSLTMVPTVCDYNRYCKSEKASTIGSYLGLVLAGILAMGLGATVAGFSILNGMPKTYDPTILIGQINPVLGFVAGAVIFLSVLSSNVLALYSATMSYLTLFSKHRFWVSTLVLGIISTLLAMYKDMLLNHFQDFLTVIGTVFIPVVSIMLVDYFLLKNKEYDAEEIIQGTKKTYWYTNGINYIAYVSFIIGALFAYIFTFVYSLATGVTVATFIVTSIVYWVLMKFFGTPSHSENVEQEII